LDLSRTPSTARFAIQCRPTTYVPLPQVTDTPSFVSFAVRSESESPALLARSVGAAIVGVDPDLAITFRLMADQVRAGLAQERLIAMLSGFCGGLALLLAGLGLYGVMSYAVSRRRTEIGIRMALGAAPGRVVGMVLGRVGLLVGAGVAVGAAVSLWAARFVSTLLYGLEPRDPVTFVLGAAVLVAVGALAGWLPARPWRGSIRRECCGKGSALTVELRMRPHPRPAVPAATLVFILLIGAHGAERTQSRTEVSPSGDVALGRLAAEIARLAESAGGPVGVTATHLETNRSVSLNGRERFPMASSYKVPVAIELLRRVDTGELRLDQMVTFEPSDIHPGSGTISELFNKPGLALSVRNLLELMLLISDNSATDVCVRLAGGPAAVTARMRAIGIEGIDVSRPTVTLIADHSGAKLPPESQWTIESLDALLDSVPDADAREAAQHFDADARDSSTPQAMTALLARVQRRDLLQPDTAELLVDIMRRCRSGPARLKGLLPAETDVAHKTGTIGGTTNDVGIITLPGSAGHVAISVFVKSSSKPIPARERVIAEIARAAHDFFLFTP
jgi:beta-lactamase class A